MLSDVRFYYLFNGFQFFCLNFICRKCVLGNVIVVMRLWIQIFRIAVCAILFQTNVSINLPEIQLLLVKQVIGNGKRNITEKPNTPKEKKAKTKEKKIEILLSLLPINNRGSCFFFSPKENHKTQRHSDHFNSHDLQRSFVLSIDAAHEFTHGQYILYVHISLSPMKTCAFKVSVDLAKSPPMERTGTQYTANSMFLKRRICFAAFINTQSNLDTG